MPENDNGPGPAIGVMRLSMEDANGLTRAVLEFSGRRITIATIMTPPLGSPVRKMFADLCEATVREIVAEAVPQAIVNTINLKEAPRG